MVDARIPPTDTDTLPQSDARFEVSRGEFTLRCGRWQTRPGLTALVGLNGAGKTTLIDVLTGRLTPTSGSVHWTPRTITLPQGADVLVRATVTDFLEYVAALRSVPRTQRQASAHEAIGLMGLHDHSTQPVRSLSGGWRRRVVVASTLVAPSDVLLLDEPTASLDVLAARQVWQSLVSVAATRPVIIASHDASAVVEFADTIAVLEAGQVSGLRPGDDIREDQRRSGLSVEGYFERLMTKAD